MRRLFIGAAKALGVGLLFIIVALCLAITIIPPFLDTRYHNGPASRHFDGAHFSNPDGVIETPAPPGQRRTGFIMRWLIGTDDRPEWPDAVAVKPSKPASFAAPKGMTATWIGHATVLVQAGGLNILTDPIWSEHASPFPPLGPKRVAAPGVRLEDLPKIDLIVISHNHYDHLDLPTLEKLWKRDRPAIVTSLGNETLLAAHGIEATGLDWGQSVSGGQLNGYGAEARIQCENYEHCPDYRVHVTRNHHWSSRWGVDRNRALWASFVIETRAGNIFFAGDTGAGNMEWPAEAARIGPIRLALIPIGAFRFWRGQMASDAHIGPRDAVTVFEKLQASTAIPIHWGTFRLSYEKWDTPPRMLRLFEDCAGLDPKRFAPVRFGQAVQVPPYSTPKPGPARGGVAQCADGSPALTALE